MFCLVCVHPDPQSCLRYHKQKTLNPPHAQSAPHRHSRNLGGGAQHQCLLNFPGNSEDGKVENQCQGHGAPQLILKHLPSPPAPPLSSLSQCGGLLHLKSGSYSYDVTQVITQRAGQRRNSVSAESESLGLTTLSIVWESHFILWNSVCS